MSLNVDLSPLDIKETRKFMGLNHYIITGRHGPGKYLKYSVVCKDVDRAIQLVKIDFKHDVKIENITLQGHIDRIDA